MSEEIQNTKSPVEAIEGKQVEKQPVITFTLAEFQEVLKALGQLPSSMGGRLYIALENHANFQLQNDPASDEKQPGQ